MRKYLKNKYLSKIIFFSLFFQKLKIVIQNLGKKLKKFARNQK